MCVRSFTLNVNQFEQPLRNHNQLGRLSATASSTQWMLIIGTHVANVCSAEQNHKCQKTLAVTIAAGPLKFIHVKQNWCNSSCLGALPMRHAS